MVEFNPNYNNLPEQVQVNKNDIKNLKNSIITIFNTQTNLSKDSTQINLSDTDIDVINENSYLLTANALMFKIIAVSQELVYLKYYTNFQGAQGEKGEQGVSVVTVENKGYTQGEGFTITHCEAVLSDGTKQYFDIQAKDGADGGGVAVIIDNVSAEATEGSLTQVQLQTLQASNNNYILFYNEKFIAMDLQSTAGHLVYTNVGQDSVNDYYIKCFNITISTLGWVLGKQKVGGGGTEIKSVSFTTLSDIYNFFKNLGNKKIINIISKAIAMDGQGFDTSHYVTKINFEDNTKVVDRIIPRYYGFVPGALNQVNYSFNELDNNVYLTIFSNYGYYTLLIKSDGKAKASINIDNFINTTSAITKQIKYCSIDGRSINTLSEVFTNITIYYTE